MNYERKKKGAFFNETPCKHSYRSEKFTALFDCIIDTGSI